MILHDFQPYTHQKRAHAQSRQASCLADALVYALNIPQGTSLAPFLTSEVAQSNRDAVVSWVRNELQNPDIELSRHCIEILLPRLERKLQTISEDMPCHF